MKLLVGLFAVLAMCCCIGTGLNSNPPESVSKVNVDAGIDGILINFTLDDNDYVPTTSDGKAVISIGTKYSTYFTQTYDIKNSNFVGVKVREMGYGPGCGCPECYCIRPIEYEKIWYRFGKILYSDFADGFGHARHSEIIVNVDFETPKGKHIAGAGSFTTNDDMLPQKAMKLAESWNDKASTFVDQHEYEEALSCYNTSLEIDPDDWVIWADKGLTLSRLGKYDESLRAYDKAIELSPSKSSVDDIWNSKGVALVNLNRYEDAIKCYDEAIRIGGVDGIFVYDYWRNKGSALEQLGKFEDAIACFDKVIELNPSERAALFLKGIALKNLSKYDEAIACFDKAIEIDPQGQNLWYEKGNALKALGRMTEADISFARATEVKKSNSEKEKADKQKILTDIIAGDGGFVNLVTENAPSIAFKIGKDGVIYLDTPRLESNVLGFGRLDDCGLDDIVSTYASYIGFGEHDVGDLYIRVANVGNYTCKRAWITEENEHGSYTALEQLKQQVRATLEPL